ncbi:MAG: PQQ-dependent sugar dehydrogenase [Phycisphaerales bacterium]|nr:PQQ-dependent sugar dehydrogenase [Phycisphaerales bacterium]
MRKDVVGAAVLSAAAMFVILAAGAALFSGCVPADSERPAPIVVAPTVNAEYLAAGIDQPAALAFLPDGRVLFAEKNTGLIRVISNDELLDEPFAALAANTAGERGLLGVAAHPDFSKNNRVYAFYARSDTGTATSDPRAIVDYRVVYLTAAGDVADGGEVFVASIAATSGTTRIGGRIAFAPDGKLLIALGDFGDETTGQSSSSPAGKVLRLNDDGSIPTDNPTTGSAVLARGIRDPRGLTVEPLSGGVFLVDRNSGGHEEVNRIDAGANYGWPSVVGVASTSDELAFAAANGNYRDPFYESGSSAPGLSGGGFNPSGRYGPRVQNDFFYGEAGTRRVIHAVLSAESSEFSARTIFADGFPSAIVDVAFTPAGTMYVACETAILRLAPVR